ncbi:NAD(P)/FAD-dependent oxidoreductase [Adhaeretor mobilis]|uniref:FAD-dependent oxidoreductase LodB n=1 Tax=Adhaeretor mobilis TaxID=1930276 RepID=A0A517N1Y4_9BACT|nr:NAD(P)/FAD-dependent oxidoreductase [Adhaeretor mobilis]QDT01151.1 Putative FAD-dependent oxidoreductase LodB [Adhaeretor mobilis]
MPVIDDQYDCLVMGGGPAGSTTAALVAQAGLKTLMVEREKFPRPHIGESLMPETYWTFQRLGVLDKLKQSNFAKKVGVQFVNHTGKESAPFFFRTHDDRESSQTWHVDRAEFDQMLFDNATEKGVHTFDCVRVLEVLFDDSTGKEKRAVGARLQFTDEHGTNEAGAVQTQEVRAKVIVDATGQQAVLGTRVGGRTINPRLKKASLWRHYRDAERDESGGGVKTIILHNEDQSAWFWYIPQANNLVSVGVVADRDYLLKGRGDFEKTFTEELAKCPGVSERLAGAEATEGIVAAKEFSYTTEQSSGNGWVLVGDAWGFIDPVYSSGVYFALKSAELAADCVIAALKSGDTSGESLGSWVDGFAKQTALIRRLVYAFYTPEFRVGKFIAEHPQHQEELVDLLIGRVFDGREGKIFDDLEPWLAAQNKLTAKNAKIAK